MTKKVPKKKKRNFLPLLLILLFLTILFVSVGIYFKSEYNEITEIKDSIKLSSNINQADGLDTNFLKAIVPNSDTNEKVIDVSNINDTIAYHFDTQSGTYVRKVYKGRRINIALTGVDSRMGDRYKHADANHVISVLLDSGKIEIISIPRDTPADAGYDDTTGQNKLTIVRAAKGRKAYFEELCRIGNLDKIHFFAELGFSQAMGIIEFLGFSNPHATLQVLRSRTALGGDDYQRVYNQAQFIRQMLFRNFEKLSGPLSDIMIGGGLLLVESDLTVGKIKDIISELKSRNFSNSLDNISIKIKPSFPAKFKVYDFSDKTTVALLSEKVKQHFKNQNDDEEVAVNSNLDISNKVKNRLNNVLNLAMADTSKSPQKAINRLNVLFEQRAWLQVADKEERKLIRNRFVDIISYSYEKRKDTLKAKQIRNIAVSEDNLFKLNAEN